MLSPHVAQSVLDHGLSLGADFAEIFVEKSHRNLVNTLSSQVQSVESGIDFGIGLRLVYNNKVLYGFTNSTQADELKRILSELAAKDIKSPVATSQSFDYRQTDDLHPALIRLTDDPATDRKIAHLLTADAAARSASDLITQTRGTCLQKEQHIQVFNSEGLYTSDERQYIRTTITSIASNGTEQATGQKSDGGMLGWELADKLNAQSMGDEASRHALTNLNAKPCPSGQMPVVIGNGFGGVIFHEACGHLLETTSVAKKASVFHDKLGEIIANPAVSAADDGTMTNEWGSLNIDDEGMPTQRTQLIKNGELTSFMVDRMGAQQTGYARTGSGRRESYKFAPASRMRNTFIEPGNDSFDDMIASIDRGIYAAQMGGGSVQPGTGEFNFAVTEGYLVEGGKIQHPIKTATLISTGPQVLKKISMVGSDFSLACGMCGSVSGSIPASVGQATLKVDEILVGGNA